MAESQERLEEAKALADQTRTEAETLRTQAAKEAGRLARRGPRRRPPGS